MKKVCIILISLLFVLTLSSCTTTSITLYKLKGSITAYNADGTILKEWDDVFIKEENYGTLIQNYLKRYGIEFYDNKSRKFIYITKSVPCIIEYHTDTLGNKDYIYDNHYNNIYDNRYDKFGHSVRYY
jgi:hypothetical protein